MTALLTQSPVLKLVCTTVVLATLALADNTTAPVSVFQSVSDACENLASMN